MEIKPILCLDFDGVLHSYTSGWSGLVVVKDEPTAGAVEFVTKALEHFKVSVYSTRSSTADGRQAMKDWLKKHGFPVDQMQFPETKPPAFVGIDDRVLTFKGVWPDMDSLINFKAWYK